MYVHVYLNFLVLLQILIFDVVDVIPEPGKPLTKHKLKVLSGS